MKPNSKTMALKEQEIYGHITINDTVRTIVNHPAFKGFNQLMLPLFGFGKSIYLKEKNDNEQ